MAKTEPSLDMWLKEAKASENVTLEHIKCHEHTWVLWGRGSDYSDPYGVSVTEMNLDRK